MSRANIALAFWSVHEEADVEHFEHGLSVLRHYFGEDRAALAAALVEARRVVRLYELTYTTAWLTGHGEQQDALAGAAMS